LESKKTKGLEQKARETTVEIIKNHKVWPLPDHALEELKLIVDKANNEIAK
jgi:hypothetical protein